ncbi:hypothetical protein [Sphingopyxis witflariensis]|uniref:DUF4375 domain-containing protein n=1 Tax=Sphingopyxis witflariensis TaxID=173675 RepID=A0A246JYZ1_9SPHN|nr:hypothetical protein [Sphingopyxis witflariensis]OWQ98388.1 hypothetical protein CDQ91_07840 [Sphingopyxis witflariensis]
MNTNNNSGMAILFLVALLLAWPTFGISILLWLGLVFVQTKPKIEKIDRAKEVASVIHPLFTGRHADFYRALDVPLVFQPRDQQRDAVQAGQHIVNYLAYNPEEAAIFMQGLAKWKDKGSAGLCHPVAAAEFERDFEAKREIHLTSYRAIQALMANNPSLHCFRNVDFSKLSTEIAAIEFKISSGQLPTANALPSRSNATSKEAQNERGFFAAFDDQRQAVNGMPLAEQRRFHEEMGLGFSLAWKGAGVLSDIAKIADRHFSKDKSELIDFAIQHLGSEGGGIPTAYSEFSYDDIVAYIHLNRCAITTSIENPINGWMQFQHELGGRCYEVTLGRAFDGIGAVLQSRAIS